MERARASMARGDFRAAAIDMRNVLKKEPSNGSAHLLLAQLSLQLGDPQGAHDELKRAMALHVDPTVAAALSGEVQLALGEAAALLKALDAHELTPAEPDSAILRGRALNALGRPVEGAAEFTGVLQANPRVTRAQVGLAESLALQGQFDAALARLAQTIEESPGAVEAGLLQSRILLQRGKYADAEAALIRARRAAAPTTRLPQQAMLRAVLAEAQLAQGKIPAAEASVKELAALSQDANGSRLLRARIALAKGDYPAATDDLQRVVASAPHLVQARTLLGAAHFAQGHLLQAESQLAEVVQVAPDNLEARKLLARVRLQLDRPDAALRVLTPALETDSADAQVYALLGAAHLRAGEPDVGLAALERGLEANPGDEALRLSLASAYLTARQADKAIEVLKANSGGTPSARRSGMLVSAIATARGPAAARTELEKIVAARPKDPELLRLAAAYFLSQREFERARAHLARALEVSPDDESTLIALVRMELAAGNAAAAESASQRALRAHPKSPAVLFALAQLSVSRGNVLQARTFVDQAVAAAPGRANVINAAGMLLLDAQQFDAALARFREASDLDKDNPLYWLNIARAQLALDRSPAARESLTAALELKPDWIPASALLVLLDLRSKGPAAAVAGAEDLRARHPAEPSVMILVGDVKVAGKQYPEAVKAYEDAERIAPDAGLALKIHEARRLGNLANPEAPLVRWLALRPEDGRIRLALAQYYMGTNRLQKAAVELETVSGQMPANPTVLNNLAWVYSQQLDARAEATARRAYELASTNAAIADTYGWILFNNRQPDKAVPLLEGAARSAAHDPEIQYHYAAALAKVGRREEAVAALRRLIENNVDFAQRPEAQKLLEQLRS